MVLEGKRAVGVEYEQDGVRKIARARREVILSGGITTPAIPLAQPLLGPREEELVLEVLRSGRLSLASGAVLKPKGLSVVPAGDRLVVEMPGGGGMGPPRERDPGAVSRDVRLGYLSAEAARREYGTDADNG